MNAILQHQRFNMELERLEKIEMNRAFCGHGIGHLLDVARIAYILSLEAREENSKELIYAAALLHDIGRARQYEDGTPHERESARIAAEILPECGFSGPETALILNAILAHRTHNGDQRQGIARYIFRADKVSRLCFDAADKTARKSFECPANDDCDWEMKNSALEY